MRRRFFVERFEGTAAVLEGETAHHLGHVLRAQTGQIFELSDGSAAWLARVESVAGERIEFTLLEEISSPPEALNSTLLLSLVKFELFEWALEKATELGVARIIPLAASRTEKGLVAASVKRSRRWQKILREASQQSRRLRVPVLDNPARPAEAFARQTAEFRFLLSERRDAPSFREIVEGTKGVSTLVPSTVAVAIGPEGGWTDDELSAARAANFHDASLGQLILRTETAVIAALAVLNYALHV